MAQDWQHILNYLEKDLKKEETDLLATKADLDKEEYKKKADELRKKVISYQNKRKSSLEKIAKQRAEARQNLIKQIKLSKKKEITLKNLNHYRDFLSTKDISLAIKILFELSIARS